MGEEGELAEGQVSGKGMVGGCGKLQPRYFVEATVLYVSFPESADDDPGGQDRKRVFGAEEALQIFKRITKHDIERMGFHYTRNHPSQLIITHLPIPPPH